jgi:hypothetical protein
MDYGLKHRSVGGAWGQKRTCRSENATSALPPKADIAQHGGNVCFMPEADINSITSSAKARIPGALQWCIWVA